MGVKFAKNPKWQEAPQLANYVVQPRIGVERGTEA